MFCLRTQQQNIPKTWSFCQPDSNSDVLKFKQRTSAIIQLYLCKTLRVSSLVFLELSFWNYSLSVVLVGDSWIHCMNHLPFLVYRVFYPIVCTVVSSETGNQQCSQLKPAGKLLIYPLCHFCVICHCKRRRHRR